MHKNSTNLTAKNVTCRGGNGIAFGSLGQYANQVRGSLDKFVWEGGGRMHQMNEALPF